MIDIKELKREIGKKLREAREEAGLSQENLAKMLGLSKVGYGALERGKNLINLQYLITLSIILKKPITFFLPNYAVTDEERDNALLDPRFAYFARMWELPLPERLKDHLYRQVKLLEDLNRAVRDAMRAKGIEPPEPPENAPKGF